MFPVLLTYGGMLACCVTHSVNIRRQMSWHAGYAFLSFFKFPHSIDALPYEVRTQLAQKKLDSLKEFLQRLESRVPSAPVPIMKTTNQPSRAATTGQGCSSGPAPNVGTALQILSCPPLPQAFKTVWQKSKNKMGVTRTDPEYYHQRKFIIGAAVFK